MAQVPRDDDQSAGSDVILALIAEQLGPPEGIECALRPGWRATQRMIGPHQFIEQFLDMMLWLVDVHGQLLLDHIPFLIDFGVGKSGVQEHVQKYFQQLLQTIMAALGVKTGALLAGKRVEITADALHRLRNFFGRALASAFKEQVLNKMGTPVERRRLVAAANPHPQTQADTGHVGHLSGGEGQTALELRDLVHGYPTALAVTGVNPAR